MSEPYYPPTLEEFLAFTRTTAFSKSNRFAVEFLHPPGLAIIDHEESRVVSMLCDEAAIPGKQILPRTLRINNLSEPRPHTVDYWNDTASFRFMIDTSWTARRFFEDWMTLCVGNNITREVGNYEDYVTDVYIHALAPAPTAQSPDAPETAIWTIKLIDAWPRSIAIAPIDYANPNINYMIVTMMFKTWVSLDASYVNREEAVVATESDTSTDASFFDDFSLGDLGIDNATAARKDDLLQKAAKGKNTLDTAIKTGKRAIDRGLATKESIRNKAAGIRKKITPFTKY